MTTEQLEKRVEELELTLNGVELNAKCLKDELRETQQKLEDASKPKISEDFMDIIGATVEKTIERFEFSNPNSYEFDFTINYDNKLELENIDFTSQDELWDAIVNELAYLFNVIEDNKDGE
jgi:hypothetical protein